MTEWKEHFARRYAGERRIEQMVHRISNLRIFAHSVVLQKSKKNDVKTNEVVLFLILLQNFFDS